MHADFVLNKNVHIPSVYAGPEHPIDENLFVGLGAVTYDDETLNSVVAEAISGGAIVGWYQGRSESGNRALGNRSILADPRNADIKNLINSKVKLREDFRPFAPSVLHEHYADWFNTNQPSPYMSRIVPVRRPEVPGITHVDGTARIQTVRAEDNERFHSLISEFYRITGVPMLLNTSFNCREPIVETPQQALSTFQRTGIDMLVIGNQVVTKVKP
jgi:carbamoyltransferase